MLVRLTADQEEACRRAIMPVEVIRVGDIRGACASMSTVLPLVVVVDEAISDADRSALMEFTTACGAELFTLERAPTLSGLGSRIFEAMRIAERRRLGTASG